MTTKTTRATPVQKSVLRWLEGIGGAGVIGTGHKVTKFGKLKGTDIPACGCSVNVIDGLKAQGWIENIPSGNDGRRRYRITEAGKTAAI